MMLLLSRFVYFIIYGWLLAIDWYIIIDKKNLCGKAGDKYPCPGAQMWGANMKKKEEKTNVMRVLEQNKIHYASYCYVDTGVISGLDVATVLGQDPAQVFKTLVTVGNSNNNFVFLVPVSQELDLKKAAKAVGEKSISMLKSKELLPLTGYIHGGCSPIGMKKPFKTVIDASAANFDTIIFSGGKIGYQVETSLDELKKVLRFELADIIA